MQIKDMNIYQISRIIFEPSILFTKNSRKKELNSFFQEELIKSIFNPELTKEGLEERQLNITYTGAFFSCAGALLFLIFGPILALLGIFDIFGLFIYTCGFYLVGFGIHIAIFRGGRASIDQIRFKLQKEPNDFKLNPRCYIRWYDFLGGAPLAILMYLLLS